MERHREEEKIYHSLLNLVSNLFEGPVITIRDAVKDLKQHVVAPPKTSIDQSIEQIAFSSESLSHILENITAMVNLSAGLTPIDLVKK